jgi:hypothetical protein
MAVNLMLLEFYMAFRPSSAKRPGSRVVFGGVQHVLPETRVDNRPTPLHKILLFVAVPSLLAWTILCLVASGDLRIALLIGCFGLAAGIFGWFLRVNQR